MTGEERREEEGGSIGRCNEQGAAGNGVRDAHGESEAEGMEGMKKRERNPIKMRSLIGDKEINMR